MMQNRGLSAMQAEEQEMPMTEQGETTEMEQSEENGGVTVEQVVQWLMQGVDPKELLDKGIPISMLKEAMQIIMEQEQNKGIQEKGLSAMGM